MAHSLVLLAICTVMGTAMLTLEVRAQTDPSQPDPSQPDLVVEDIILSPAEPYAGDMVRFSAVVRNQGEAPTPEGVVIGGVFILNGSVVAYTDTYTSSLAPGEAVTLVANGGGATGDGTWNAQEGGYTVGFLVDDVNRIEESDEANNELTLNESLTITTRTGPDLVVSNLTWTPAVLRAGESVTFSATVTNEGVDPTPEGTVVGVAFTVDAQVVAQDDSYTASIAPGESVTITGRQGPSGDGTWTAVAGDYAVQAVVDPEGLINESRDDNNALTIDFVIDKTRQETARPADAFVDSIGVNVHLRYLDTAYGDYEGIVKPRLQESGIRHIRDGGTLFDSIFTGKLNDLATVGIRANLIMAPHEVPVDQVVALIKSVEASIVSVEGPNEPNVFTPELFPDETRDYQNRLYAAIKADPATAWLPVLAPSLAYGTEDSGRLGPVACDLGNMHSYTGGQLPDTGLDTRNIPAAQEVCPGKSMASTEVGYHNALNNTWGQPGVSEGAAAKYVPRTYLEHFNREVVRTYLYEFIDEKPDPAGTDQEQHFGLVRYDGSPKPAFMALKNLIGLLGDPDAESPGAEFIPASLSYTLSGNVTNLRHMLLQKQDGSYYLILWLNAYSYDVSNRSDVTVPPQALTLAFEAPFARAAVYRPGNSADALETYSNFAVLTLDVPDEALVVELVP